MHRFRDFLKEERIKDLNEKRYSELTHLPLEKSSFFYAKSSP
jgi:hypothetical protein